MRPMVAKEGLCQQRVAAWQAARTVVSPACRRGATTIQARGEIATRRPGGDRKTGRARRGVFFARRVTDMAGPWRRPGYDSRRSIAVRIRSHPWRARSLPDRGSFAKKTLAHGNSPFFAASYSVQGRAYFKFGIAVFPVCLPSHESSAPVEHLRAYRTEELLPSAGRQAGRAIPLDDWEEGISSPPGN